MLVLAETFKCFLWQVFFMREIMAFLVHCGMRGNTKKPLALDYAMGHKAFPDFYWNARIGNTN